MICNGFGDKSFINTDTYFDQMCKINLKKKKKLDKINKSNLKKLKNPHKKKQKKKKTSKKQKILDIDCRICFHHKVYDVNPVVYCSG